MTKYNFVWCSNLNLLYHVFVFVWVPNIMLKIIIIIIANQYFKMVKFRICI